MHKAMLDNNNRLPYAYMTKLLNDFRKSPSFEWLTRNIVNKAFLKFKANLEEEKRRGEENDLVSMDVDVPSICKLLFLFPLLTPLTNLSSVAAVQKPKQNK